MSSEAVPISDLFPHLEQPEEPTTPSGSGLIPDRFLNTKPTLELVGDWEDTELYSEYRRRVKNNQDLVVLVSDYENQRGTGKTTLSIKLCEAFDRTDEGFTPEKAHLAPQELINAYTRENRQSALLLDEAEAGVNTRDAMTKVNKVFSKIMSMARVEEKYLVLNMPAANHIDKNIIDLSDYWIMTKRKGLARVYKIKNNPFRGRSFPKAVNRLRWDNISHNHPVYRHLTREKKKRLRNPGENGGTGYLTYEEHKQAVEKAEREAIREARDDWIYSLLTHPRVETSQTALADAFGVSQSLVSNVKQDREDDGSAAAAATSDD